MGDEGKGLFFPPFPGKYARSQVTASLEHSKPVSINSLNGHKSALKPHRKEGTHNSSEVSRFVFKSKIRKPSILTGAIIGVGDRKRRFHAVPPK